MPQLDMSKYSKFCEKYLAGEYRRIVQFLKDELKVKPDGRILEVGPGPGWIGIFLAQALPGAQITGLELSDDMRRVAEENKRASGVTNLVFTPGNAEQMPFDRDSFDGVVSNGSLHHWVRPVSVLNEVSRVLKPEGVFAIFDGRRDIGIGARLLFQILSGIALLDPRVPGLEMRRGWRSSINAGYTPEELATMASVSEMSGYYLQEALFDLVLHSPIPGGGASAAAVS
jgi:ubiquinone/menaquinone biosynthesis C-methylase UbiE